MQILWLGADEKRDVSVCLSEHCLHHQKKKCHSLGESNLKKRGKDDECDGGIMRRRDEQIKAANAHVTSASGETPSDWRHEPLPEP